METGFSLSAKVAGTALQNAASIAGLMTTTEAMVTEAPKKDEPVDFIAKLAALVPPPRAHRTRDEARADLFDHLERFHNPRMRRRVARRDQEFQALIKPSVETGWNPERRIVRANRLQGSEPDPVHGYASGALSEAP